jgi:hypothetical protein
MNLLERFEDAIAKSIEVTLEGNAQYINLSVYPGNANINNDPASQMRLTIVPAANAVSLYSLPSETTFDGVSDYVDTGIKLSDYESYTVLIDAEYISVRNASDTIIDNMNEISPYPGWTIDARSNGTLGLNKPINNIIGVLPGLRFKAAIRKNHTKYTLFTDTVHPTGLKFSPGTQAVSHPVLLGAYYNNGNISRFANATIYSCDIYSGVMTDAEISAFLSGE